MIGFAVVGYDHAHLPRYVPALAGHPSIELTALVAPRLNRGLARKDADRYGAQLFEDLDRFCAEAGVDAAYIGAPPDMHLAIVERLAPMGFHLLCDKPISITLDDATQIIELADEHKVRLMVPFNPRYQKPVQLMKAMIERTSTSTT